MDSGELETTRRALHAVAELLLAGPQYRASGTIRLRVQPGGFATVADPELRVDRTELVSRGRRFTLQGATCAAVARAAGIDVGPPVGLYAEGAVPTRTTYSTSTPQRRLGSRTASPRGTPHCAGSHPISSPCSGLSTSTSGSPWTR